MDENFSKDVQEFRKFLDDECKGIISNKPNYEGFSPIDSTKTNLFWPCMLYQVEVCVDSADLDIFERTILKLAECSETKTKEIAEDLCMKEETVEFIQNRLVKRNLLQERVFSLTEYGKAKLDKFAKESSKKTEVVSLLRDLYTGLFLDFVEISPAKNSFSGTFPDKEKKSILTRLNLPGENPMVGNVIYPKDFSAFNRLKELRYENPSNFLILRAIRKFQKAAGKASPVKLNDKSNFVEIKSRELVLVHTKAFTNFSGDIFSTDAAGLGMSDVFTDFLKNADSKSYPWIEKIYDKGVVFSEEKDKQNLIEEKVRFEYPRVSKIFYDSLLNLKSLGGKVNSDINLRDEAKRIGEKIIYSSYTAFEYALKLYYDGFNDENAENVSIMAADADARKQNSERLSETKGFDERTKFFYRLAQNLGFNVTSENLSLLKVQQGKLDSMREGDVPELMPLLCLALAYADSDSESPIACLAKEKPDFIREIFDLKALRDKTFLAHGPGLMPADVSKENIEKKLRNVIYYARFLNEKLAKDFAEIDKRTQNCSEGFTSSASKILQNRYVQKLALCKDFGFSAVNSLSTNLVKQMINWNITLQERKSVATSSSSVVQQFFECAVLSILKNVSPPENNLRNAEHVLEKCREAGFYLRNGNLPDSLSTVKPAKIKLAVTGGGCQTLGSAVNAFVLLLSARELKAIAYRNEMFISDVAKILEGRGHSDLNEYSEQEVSTWKKIVTGIIKEIIEYIC